MGLVWDFNPLNFLGGLVQTGIQAGITNRQNRENRAWQERMYQQQVKDNRYNMQLAYQNQVKMLGEQNQSQLQLEQARPLNNLQGLKAAGMNVGLALNGGAGTSGTASSASSQLSQAGNVPSPAMIPITMDIAGAMRSFAEAIKAEKEGDKAGAEVFKIEDERAAIQQGIIESQKRIDKMLSEIGVNESVVNLNNTNKDWQEIQNRIAAATEQEQIDITKENLENLKQSTKKAFEETEALKIENKQKEELFKAQISNLWANTRLTFLQAAGQKIHNGQDMRKFNEEFKILQATASKIAAEAENEKDFKNRWEKEKYLEELGIWVNGGAKVVSEIIGVLGALIPAGGLKGAAKNAIKAGENMGNYVGAYNTNITGIGA